MSHGGCPDREKREKTLIYPHGFGRTVKVRPIMATVPKLYGWLSGPKELGTESASLPKGVKQSYLAETVNLPYLTKVTVGPEPVNAHED